MNPLKIVTPQGVAQYCSLNPEAPSTQFDHEWNVKLIVTAEAAAPFIAKAQAFFQEVREEHGVAKPTNPLPIIEEVDAAGVKTGNFIFKCKRGAAGVKKDGTPWTNKPHVLFDADGGIYRPEGVLGSGTVLRVGLSIQEYFKPNVGVKFYIDSAKILNPVFRGGASADDYDDGDTSMAPANYSAPAPTEAVTSAPTGGNLADF
jgi:hypothetical protein